MIVYYCSILVYCSRSECILIVWVKEIICSCETIEGIAATLWKPAVRGAGSSSQHYFLPFLSHLSSSPNLNRIEMVFGIDKVLSGIVKYHQTARTVMVEQFRRIRDNPIVSTVLLIIPNTLVHIRYSMNITKIIGNTVSCGVPYRRLHLLRYFLGFSWYKWSLNCILVLRVFFSFCSRRCWCLHVWIPAWSHLASPKPM